MTGPTNRRRDGRQADLRGTARQRLLDAAAEEFPDRGYDGTSLEAIARRAGLTRGAVYWNFASKHELFVAVLEQRIDRPARELMRVTETASADEPTAAAVSEGLASLVREQAPLIMLLFEYWAEAARDPKLREAFIRREHGLRDALAKALEARHDTVGVPLTYPAQRLATAILALGQGIAMTKLVDPEVPDQLHGEILDILFDGLAARAGRSERLPPPSQMTVERVLRRPQRRRHDRPGNTIASFEAALAAGVDMIEFDVLRTRTRIVLAHDFGDVASRSPLTLDEGLELFSRPEYGAVSFLVDLKLPATSSTRSRRSGAIGSSIAR